MIGYKQIKQEVKAVMDKIMGKEPYLCVLYGNQHEMYDETTDVDICIYAEYMTMEQREKIALEVEDLHKRHGLKFDLDMEYRNKTAFSRADVEELKLRPPFPEENGLLMLTPVQFQREFLDSREMRLRLLLNIFTTDSILMEGDQHQFEKVVEEIYGILLDIVIRSSREYLDGEKVLDKLLYGNSEGHTYKNFLGYDPKDEKLCCYMKEKIQRVLRKRGVSVTGIIYITGSSGSGTSTLGNIIKSRYGANLIESDDITMLPTDPPFQFPRSKEERLPILRQRLSKDRLNVIVGSINDWGNEVIKEASMFILLYADFEVREKRIWKREQERFGSRLLEDEIIKANFKRLIDWTRQYDTFEDCRSLKHHRALYDSFGKVKYMFENREVSEILPEIQLEIERLVKI